MGASVRPDPVADYLAARGATTQAPSAAPPASSNPVSDYLMAKAHGISQGRDFHAEYASGVLAKRNAQDNAGDKAVVDAEDASQPGYLERAATHVLNAAQGIPGVERIESGAGALASKLTDHPMDRAESLATLRDATGKIGGKTAIAEKMLGSVAVAPFLPASAVRAGALLGGANAALSADDESLGARAAKTALGAGTGALVGKVAQGVGNVANRSGITDAMAASLRRVGSNIGPSAPIPALPGKMDLVTQPIATIKQVGAVAAQSARNLPSDVGQAIGTQGAVNDLAQTRQSILDKLPTSSKPAAEAVLEHSKAYRAQAEHDYALARADDAPISDPRVQQIVQDPSVQRAYDWAQKVYEASGRKVPQKVIQAGAPAGPPQKLLPSVGGYQPTSLVPATGPGTPSIPQMTTDLPNPEILSLTKRHLQDFVDRGMSIPGISRAEAATVLPKLDALRDVLHDVSPTWKTADAHFAQAKNFEEAFDAAYKAKSGAKGATAAPDQLKTQPAISDWASRGVNAPERIAGQQAGTMHRLAAELRNAPIGSNINETIAGAGKLFKPSESAAAYRAPAFGTAAAAQDFTDYLGSVGAKGAKEAASFGPASASPLKPWQFATKPNMLARPAGVQARTEIAGRLADPAQTALIRDRLASAARGRDLAAALASLGLSTGNAAVTP